MDVRFITMLRREWYVPGKDYRSSGKKVENIKPETKLLGLFLIWVSSSILAMVHVLELFWQNTLSSIIDGWAIIFLIVLAFGLLGHLVKNQSATN